MPKDDGTLVNDVIIGDYERPWNARSDVGYLASGIPKSHFWATDPNGINQVGCIYTAQGFEFDYVGVIFGKDLIYDFEQQTWQGNKKCDEDSVVIHVAAKAVFSIPRPNDIRPSRRPP
jgi:DUF2075 family protein